MDRAAQKAALLAAARAKAAAEAQAQAPAAPPVASSDAQFRDATDVKEKDVRMQGVRVSDADEEYVAATYDAPAVEAEASPAAAPSPSPSPPPSPLTSTKAAVCSGCSTDRGAAVRARRRTERAV